jgi:hypothetical protein
MMAMLVTRLQRSASRAMGKEKTAIVVDTDETSAPNWLSYRPHSDFSNGSIETTIWRSMESTVISRKAMPKANHA